MRVLLIWPKFPMTFWSFEGVLELAGKKSYMPPLGLLTVAGILPQDWSFRLVDRNAHTLREEDWNWADIVMLSAMIVQQDDFAAMIREAKSRGKPVAVGGPYVTSVPQDAEAAGADYIVLDEGEITIPPFVEAFMERKDWIRAGDEPALRFSAVGKKPDVTTTPTPRFDLVDFSAYDSMPVQYSRGCPFLCEFCDIINLYGRKPRTKHTDQFLAELESLYQLGWQGSVFLVDDNFIGNKKNVKALLAELKPWLMARNRPFLLTTEASIDLASDDDLIEQMLQSNIGSVFIGIETPDVDSLALTRKHQNNRHPMMDDIRKLQQAGMHVMAGFIIGFDNEKPGAGERIVRFVEECNISLALLSMLQVLPNTGLWTRLEREGRLGTDIGTINQTSTLNFLPTRPAAEIVEEYLDAYQKLYDPVRYIERAHRLFLELGTPELDRAERNALVPPPPLRARIRRSLRAIRLLPSTVTAPFKVIWRQGVVRPSRSVFWRRMFSIIRHRPRSFGFYATVCAHNEHFLRIRDALRQSVRSELPSLPTEVYVPPERKEEDSKRRKPVFASHLANESEGLKGPAEPAAP